MSALIIAFCVHEDRAAVARAVLTPDPPMLIWHDAASADVAAQHRPLFLLAIGPEGGAALARWVEAHGLDGVRGIGLVGVTAPWAERVCRCEGRPHYAGEARRCGAERLPLGPLEPLRAVAERARLCAPLCPSCRSERVRPDTDDCKHFICGCGHAFTPTPVRIVLACAPDDGVCKGCGGKAAHQYRDGSPYNMLCAPCQGTGKALSSADVAAELLGHSGDTRWEMAINGGVSAQMYQTRAELDKHGLAAALKAAVG